MKTTNALLLTVSAFAIGFGLSNIAMSDYTAPKIAVVDVSAVVSKSVQVQTLKKEQRTKMQDLNKWLKTAKEDISKQQTDDGKKKLAAKYDSEFSKKRETIAKDYQQKLKTIDKNITDTIASQATAQGYTMVISKGVVLYGGDDITESVQKVVK